MDMGFSPPHGPTAYRAQLYKGLPKPEITGESIQVINVSLQVRTGLSNCTLLHVWSEILNTVLMKRTSSRTVVFNPFLFAYP
jgi:hypothetical protein